MSQRSKLVIITINCSSLILLLLFIYPADSAAGFAYGVTYPGGADSKDLCYLFRDRGVPDEGAGDGGLRCPGDCAGCVQRVLRTPAGEAHTGEAKSTVYLVEQDVLKFVDIII